MDKRCINVNVQAIFCSAPEFFSFKAQFDIENNYSPSLLLFLCLIFNIKNRFECSGLERARMEKMRMCTKRVWPMHSYPVVQTP